MYAPKIALVGLVTPASVGDALQYYFIIKSIDNLVPEADATFFCPYLRENLAVFKDVKSTLKLIDSSLSSLSFKHGFNTEKSQVKKISPVLYAIQVLKRRRFFPQELDKLIFSPMVKSIISFNAALFGGHTISKPTYYATQYEIMRSAVRGPIVTAPISISKLLFEHHRMKALPLERLKNSLNNLNFIYVRGPHSYATLIEDLNVDEAKIAMALDSGFGARQIFADYKTSDVSNNNSLKIVIIPRKEYFFIYKNCLYDVYLKTISNLILWLFRNFNAEIFLVSQFKEKDQYSDYMAISDILETLRKLDKSSKYTNRLKIANFTAIEDAYKLYAVSNLVITSRMHGGIMAMSAGTPAIFALPSADQKVRDILSFLDLDETSLLIDIFDSNAIESDNFILKVSKIIENIDYYRKKVEFTVNRSMVTVEQPLRTFTELL